MVGDLAVIGFNHDGDRDIQIVLLTDVTNETIFIRDDEPNAAGGFADANEGTLQWSTGLSTISAGTVVTFSDVDSSGNTSFGASIGTLTSVESTFVPAGGGDAIFFYQTGGVFSDTPTGFIYAYGNTSTGTQFGDLTNTGLSAGSTAVGHNTGGTPDGGYYNGSRSSEASFSDYISLISDSSNWVYNTSDGEAILASFNSTAFTTSAIPEPSPGLLLTMLGMGMLLFVRKRRSCASNA